MRFNISLIHPLLSHENGEGHVVSRFRDDGSDGGGFLVLHNDREAPTFDNQFPPHE
jgi:hypothetical protein